MRKDADSPYRRYTDAEIEAANDSQFEKIPMSYEHQKRIIDDQINDIADAIREVKASKGERFTIKQMARLMKSLQARLEKLKADWKKDSVITFEQLGVDMMFVDESDNYKNLFLYIILYVLSKVL